jgi:hypothetical protein
LIRVCKYALSVFEPIFPISVIGALFIMSKFPYSLFFVFLPISLILIPISIGVSALSFSNLFHYKRFLLLPSTLHHRYLHWGNWQ